MRVGAACRAAPVRQAPLGMPGLTSNGHSLQSRHALRISVRQPRKAEQPHSSQLTAERASVAGGDKYKDASGNFRFLAATQFEATDARRAFPCWDEPAFKAVFATILVIDPSLTAVSNTAIVSEQMEDGRKVVRFADTIPMSTYLVAF